MGENAELITEETKPEEINPETEKKEPVEGKPEGGEEGKTQADPKADPKGEEENQEKNLGIEIIRESGESQAPTAKRSGFEKRVSKLNHKNEVVSKERDEERAEKENLAEQLKITKIALEQERANKSSGPESSSKPPNPDDFDAGIYDPEYLKKKETWGYDRQLTEVKEEIAKEISEFKKQTLQTQANDTQAIELNKRQSAHYVRAEKLGATDYEAKEDVAIEKLGLENVNHIIGNFDDSQNILYYLGTNPLEAEALAELIKRNAIQGVAEIGRLRSEIKIKPKTKTIAPEPYENLEGSVPSSDGKRGPKGCKIY